MSARVLLDTHVLIWAFTDPRQLSPTSRSLLEDRNSELLASAASAWEIATKVRLGKLPGAEVLLDDYEGHLRRLGAEQLRISTRHALQGGGLAWSHRDPFDRILVAQAVLEAVPLVTADPVFREVAGLQVRW